MRNQAPSNNKQEPGYPPDVGTSSSGRWRDTFHLGVLNKVPLNVRDVQQDVAFRSSSSRFPNADLQGSSTLNLRRHSNIV